jgi:hypothetical protein
MPRRLASIPRTLLWVGLSESSSWPSVWPPGYLYVVCRQVPRCMAVMVSWNTNRDRDGARVYPTRCMRRRFLWVYMCRPVWRCSAGSKGYVSCSRHLRAACMLFVQERYSCPKSRMTLTAVSLSLKLNRGVSQIGQISYPEVTSIHSGLNYFLRG